MTVDSPSWLKILLPMVAAGFCFVLLSAAVEQLMAGTHLDLGTSINLPTVGHGRFLALWMMYSCLAAAALTTSCVRFLARPGMRQRAAEIWNRASDRKWVLYGTVLGLLVPAALRTFVLGWAPLTDDESAYRFMAQVLADGSVYAESPGSKLFFDNRFMVNDGKFYAHFFVGWPALLLPGVWLGFPGFMNCVYSALTVAPLFGVLRGLVGSGWARAGLVLYLTSPMLMVAAATETSHTSCTAALAWFTWLLVRARAEPLRRSLASGAAFSFCVAFFVRPTAALGFGLPLLGWWLFGLEKKTRIRSVVAFAVPAILMAGLFLKVNEWQTGSYFEVAYQRAYSYAEENDFRFALWDRPIEGGFSELEFRSIDRSLAVTAAALFRLNVVLLGWPLTLVWVVFAGREGFRRVLGWSIVSFLLVHFLTNNVGVDTFAPMHYFELAWPLILLVICGFERANRLLTRFGRLRRVDSIPSAALVSLTLTSLISYAPVRLSVVGSVAANIAIPQRAAEASDLGPSVIFVQDPFIHYCRSTPASGWVFSRPNNDPRLEDEILWVNHLTVERNRQLMLQFPNRTGYVMGWRRECDVVFIPLDSPAADLLPANPELAVDQADRASDNSSSQ